MIELEKEKETLLVPLYGKALESRKSAPILYDEKALNIVENIAYDFNSLKTPKKTNVMMCIRAKLFDNYVAGCLEQEITSTVMHLGCGLDSRYTRINNERVDWYDLDYKEVIDIRRDFFPETEKYHLLASSVTELGWIERIPVENKQYLVVAEGLFMYLREEEIKAVLCALEKWIGHYTLIFDAYSVYTAKRIGRHPSLKKTGAEVHWGIDDPQELTGWMSQTEFIETIYFTSNEIINKLGMGTRLVYKIANLFSAARNAQRILVYRIG
ncbi:MAG TPA: class I SAM-dependent methyltransferase [bacterium]|nr:class I SAM-dependent methyltransferase [bacterium]